MIRAFTLSLLMIFAIAHGNQNITHVHQNIIDYIGSPEPLEISETPMTLTKRIKLTEFGLHQIFYFIFKQNESDSILPEITCYAIDSNEVQFSTLFHKDNVFYIHSNGEMEIELTIKHANCNIINGFFVKVTKI